MLVQAVERFWLPIAMTLTTSWLESDPVLRQVWYVHFRPVLS